MLRKMVFIFMGVLFVMMTTPGCIRVNTVTRERVDMEVDGNQGYLTGEGTFQPKEPRKRTKTFIKIDIDLSGFQDLEEPEKEKAIQEIEPEELDEDALKSSPVFNKGYVFHKDTEIEEVAHGYTEEYSEIEIIEPEPEKEISFIIYTVKKNESLWDIAARPEIYGNPSKWKLIYEANKDSIKKPNLIRPGMKLKIPQIEP